MLAAGDGDLARASGVFTIGGEMMPRFEPRTQSFQMFQDATVIDYAHATFVGGTADDLGNGAVLEIQGPLTADGAAIQASRIKFDVLGTKPSGGHGR